VYWQVDQYTSAYAVMLVDTSRTLELPRGQLQRTTRRNLGHTLTAVRAARGGGTPVLLDQLPELCAAGRSAQVLIPGLDLSPRRRVVQDEFCLTGSSGIGVPVWCRRTWCTW